jgi:hypothetical protein
MFSYIPYDTPFLKIARYIIRLRSIVCRIKLLILNPRHSSKMLDQFPRRNLYEKRDIVFDFPATCFLGYDVLFRTIEGVNVSTVSFLANI